jgi:hypothetical protein
MKLMKMAVDEFPSQYSYDKHVLGEKSMLFIRQEWNSHSWKAIKNTQEFHVFLLDQMRNKSRTKNGRLSVKMAFGHVKRNDTVVESSFFEDENSTAHDHSQKDELRFSPAPKISSKKIRETGWEYTDLVGQMINRLYRTPNSFLFHGFLEEHSKIFAILLLQSVHKEMEDTSSGLMPVLKDDQALLSSQECRKYFLDLYMSRPVYKNNTQGHEPKKGKYPPTDEENETIQVPPSFHAWLHAERTKGIGNPANTSSVLYPPPSRNNGLLVSPVPNQQHF